MASRRRTRLLLLALLSAPVCLSLAQQASPPTPAAPQASPAAKPDAKAETKPEAKPHSTAEDNPFPEDVSKQAEAAARADEKADRSAAASGSVAGSAAEDSSSSSRDKFQDLDLLGDHDSRISNGAGGVVVNTKLSDDDLRIGRFYMQTGDYQGAYDRFKEAVAVNPDNPESVFELAEAARKVNHKDEALENYKIYLAAVPDGPHAKAIRKALNELAKK